MKNHGKKFIYLYGLADGIMAMIPTIYNSYWSLFLTSAAGLDAAGNALVLSIIGVADVLSILLVSFLVQKCNLKFGKFRFWVLLGGVGCAITRVLAFTPLMFGSVAYFSIMIVVSSSLYNLAYCAYMGMIPLIGKTQEERITTVTAQQQMVALTSIIVSLISVSVIQNVGYWALSAIAAVAIIVSVIPMYIATKDVDVYVPEAEMSAEEKEAQPSVWDMIRLLFNVPMIVYLIGSVCKIVGSIGLAILVSYYYTYVYGDMSMLTVYLTLSTVLQLIGASLAPAVNKIVKGSRNTFAAGLLIYAVLLGIAKICGGGSAVLFTVCMAIGYMGWAISHTADAAYYSYIGDYVEYKHKKNIQPFLMSMISIFIKIGILVTNLVVGWGMVAVGFDPNNVTEAAQTGIVNLTIMMPLITLVIGGVVTFASPLSDKKVNEIKAELDKRHARQA